MIKLPKHIVSASQTSSEFVEEIYPQIELSKHIINRAILTPRNNDVDEINKRTLDKMYEEKFCLKNIDTISKEDNENLYRLEFLNSLSPSGIPPHNLELKKNCHVY